MTGVFLSCQTAIRQSQHLVLTLPPKRDLCNCRVQKWYKEICTSIIDARPDDADTDLLSAILLAANELKASDTQARHLMLLCNGLNTAPMLNFAETPFWSDATSIDEIISQLLKLNYLSADLLEDVDVTWAYLTSTSGLQKSLSPSMESRLLSFWQAYFDACGAKSVVFKKTC